MQALAPLRRMQTVLGTYVEIGIDQQAHANPLNVTQAQAACASAFGCLRKLHALLSFQEPASQLTQLNQHPGRWVALAPAVIRVLSLAKSLTQMSDGLFNCTLAGKLISAGKLPDHGGYYALTGEHSDLEILPGRARLRAPVRITLDGIAKGFAVDTAIATLKRAGVQHGWVNAGGDVRAFGNVQLPITLRTVDGLRLPLCNLYRGAIATSQTGQRTDLPGLIVSQHTKLSAIQKPETFTVAATFAWRADALTKVAANAPKDQAAARVAALGGHLLTPLAGHFHA